jgi:hypothetical protein
LVPLLASNVSYKLRPSACLACSALRCRLASSSFCAASHSSLLSRGASAVPPETKPDDMVLVSRWRGGEALCRIGGSFAGMLRPLGGKGRRHVSSLGAFRTPEHFPLLPLPGAAVVTLHRTALHCADSSPEQMTQEAHCIGTRSIGIRSPETVPGPLPASEGVASWSFQKPQIRRTTSTAGMAALLSDLCACPAGLFSLKCDFQSNPILPLAPRQQDSSQCPSFPHRIFFLSSVLTGGGPLLRWVVSRCGRWDNCHHPEQG